MGRKKLTPLTSSASFKMLSLIERGINSPSAVAHHLGVDASNVNKLFKGLEATKIITKENKPNQYNIKIYHVNYPSLVFHLIAFVRRQARCGSFSDSLYSAFHNLLLKSIRPTPSIKHNKYLHFFLRALILQNHPKFNLTDIFRAIWDSKDLGFFAGGLAHYMSEGEISEQLPLHVRNLLKQVIGKPRSDSEIDQMFEFVNFVNSIAQLSYLQNPRVAEAMLNTISFFYGNSPTRTKGFGSLQF